MARDLTAGMQSEVQAQSLRPVIFYEGEFASGTLRLWTGIGTFSWNGQSWTGAGNLLAISPVVETPDVRAVPMKAQLSGMPPSLVALAYGQTRQGKPGRVWFGAMDAAGTIVPDPYLAFVGRLDVTEDEDDDESAMITISYENRLIDLERPRVRRWTHEDQQIDHPGDLGLQYAASLADQVLEW